MASFKVHGGDFKAGNGSLMLGQISLPKDGRLGAETMPANLLISVEVATQENQKKFLGTVGGGAIGLALLGPLGAIGGMLLGGNKTSVTFVGTLRDDRTFVASADASTFAKLKAIATKASAERARIVARTPSRPQVAVPSLTRSSPSADQFRLPDQTDIQASWMGGPRTSAPSRFSIHGHRGLEGEPVHRRSGDR